MGRRKKRKEDTKRERGNLIRVYILKVMTMRGIKIECAKCHSTENLILHHKKYGNQTISDYDILCDKCHKIEHKKKYNNSLKYNYIRTEYENGIRYVCIRGMKFTY